MLLTSDLLAETRPNVLRINLDAIRGSFHSIRNRVGPAVRIFCALKANAYGFGLEPVGRCLAEAGAYGLAVVDRAHAIALRRAGLSLPILVYPNDVVSAACVESYERWNLIPSIFDHASAVALSRYATRELSVAVKLDVGQERLGVPAEDAASFLEFVAALPRLRIDIVNAHPSVPVEEPRDCLAWELQRFLSACDGAARRGVRIPTRLFASSKALAVSADTALDAVDPGHMLFPPSALQSLSSRLIHARAINRSRFVDQAPFALREGMRYGVIPVGTSDGIGQCHSGWVLIRGRRCPIVGKPSLEHMRIDLSDVPDAKPGDEVVLIGRQQEATITLDDVLRYQQFTRSVDIAMSVRETVRREYA